jgi:hypothetical protein
LRIYITYCSAKKNDSLRGTCKKVTPDILYVSPRIQRFMKVCKERKVKWAILSDLYGVWFPEVEHEWYEKGPDAVTEEEFTELVADFDKTLDRFGEIWFYYNPSRFHRLYRRLLDRTSLKEKVRRFTHYSEIA